MSYTITVPRIGDGSEENPFRPDTSSKWWQVIEEHGIEFLIEIFE
jgi:hypothetical protein